MYPPLPLGTVLQSRYRVLQLLGQGGFGRTYLAEDQNRFKEPCAVKEFLPQQGEDHFSSKATELFRREAAILYQIQHPQIPQFRETFEIENRLFLVQDYVEGPSYRELLNQRRSQNATFSEAEVRQLLQQLLPVLAHIHAKGIIHRDISPDNILRRNRDRLPVLIDFGVVKEVVTRVQMSTMTQHSVTTVGKPGYAPSEQMQSGRAYPSSDLYALAVTAIVLLTGREPQDIFDDVNLNWNWQQYATISPGLAQVLQRATSYRPGDRYQSVSEMAQALGAAGNLASPYTPNTPPQTSAPAATPASQMRTVAVARPHQSTTMVNPQTPKTARAPLPSVLDDDEGSVWENPLAVGALALGLAVLAGIGGWGLVTALNRTPEPSESTEVPSIEIEPERPTDQPEPSPTPQPTEVEPIEYDQQLSVSVGEPTTVEGSLNANETVNYRLQGQDGQTLLAQLEGDGILMTVLGPDGDPLDRRSRRVLGWTGELDASGEYVIQLNPVEGVEQSTYSLRVALSDSDDSQEPEEPSQPQEPSQPEEPSQPQEPPRPQEPEAPAEEPEIISEQRVRFPDGQTSILVANSAGPARVRRYVVNLNQGTVLEVEVENSTAATTFTVLSPSDVPLRGAESARLWEGSVPAPGDYAIDVAATDDSEFTLRIGVQ